jgi:hypothetical protein
VPVYSVFRGRIGAVDTYLAKQRRLTLIESSEEIRSKIRPIKRTKTMTDDGVQKLVLGQIMSGIDRVINDGHLPESASVREA